MKKRLLPKTSRPAEEKKPQGSVPHDGKSQVTSREVQTPSNEPAAKGFVVEDEDRIEWESRRWHLKEALGVGDDAFCDALLHQLNRLFPPEDGHVDFDFVLSMLKNAEPIDALDANLVLQMALCQLGITRQSEILLQPIHFELPADVAVALHRSAWDTKRMAPQRIKIDDQPVRLMAERMVTRLMQAYATLLHTRAAYLKATKEARHKTQNDERAQSSKQLNGSRQSEERVNGNPMQQISSIEIQKSNDPAAA
jgi:hypothetical protein